MSYYHRFVQNIVSCGIWHWARCAGRGARGRAGGAGGAVRRRAAAGAGAVGEHPRGGGAAAGARAARRLPLRARRARAARRQGAAHTGKKHIFLY